jgi:hypothetical protein
MQSILSGHPCLNGGITADSRRRDLPVTVGEGGHGSARSATRELDLMAEVIQLPLCGGVQHRVAVAWVTDPTRTWHPRRGATRRPRPAAARRRPPRPPTAEAPARLGRRDATTALGPAGSGSPDPASRDKHPVPGTPGRPAQRRDLDLHPPPALHAVPRWFQRQLPVAVKVGLRRRQPAAVGRAAAVPAERAGRHPCRVPGAPDPVHSVFWNSLMGMFSSTSRFRSALAGRPRVVR